MIDWRERVRDVLDETQLLALSSVVIASELLVRAVLSTEFSSLWIVAWPPIITVTAFGLAATANRLETTEARSLNSRRDVGRQAVLFGLIAIFGHAVALIAGVALFFAVDTPLRFFVYWLGLDIANWTFAYLGLPLLGLAMGTAIVWVLPATIAADVSRGTSLRTALRRLVTGVSRKRPFFDRLAAVNMSVVFSVFVSIVLSLRVLRAAGINEYVRGEFYIGSHAAMLVLLLAFAVVLALVPLALAVQLSFTSPSRIDSIEPQPLSSNGPFSGFRPVLTIVLVIILVVSLIAVAGTARTEDIRPMDGRDAEPLPDSTGLMVLQAHQNLIAYNYEISEYDLTEHPDELENKGSINLQRRESSAFYGSSSHCWWAWANPIQAESPTVAVLQANPTGRVPNYFPGNLWDAMKDYQTILYYHLPEVGQNATVEFSEEYTEDTITIETTDAEAILSKTGRSDILSQERLVVDEAWMKIEIDRETNTTREVEYRFDVQYQTEDGARERESEHVRYDVEIGSDIDPCDGERPLEERVWRVLLY